MEISNIKLRVNHNVSFNLEDTKIKNLLIIGNTINFFGFFNDDEGIDMMSMNKNDRYHYMWVLKRCIEKTNIYIIGESEEKEYYINLFNYVGSLGIKVNWKFMETKEPKDYLEKLSLLKNMKFDYIVGNPPFGSVGGDTLHLKCVDKVYDLFTKKMLMIMPYSFATKDTKSFKKYQDKFSKKLSYIKEYSGDNFEGTCMGSVGIFEFDKDESEIITIEDISGVKVKKSKLYEINNFTKYEEEIISYLQCIGPQEIVGDVGRLNCWKTANNIDELINKSLKNINFEKFGLLVNRTNGSFNGKFMNSNNGLIVKTYEDYFNFFINHKTSSGYNTLLFNSFIEAKNCKIALLNPLLRFTCYKLQDSVAMIASRVYKYIPAIDWEDQRCTTDEGLLEMCGCPKDKAKEYAEYVKNYVDERDKEFESRKKRK